MAGKRGEKKSGAALEERREKRRTWTSKMGPQGCEVDE